MAIFLLPFSPKLKGQFQSLPPKKVSELPFYSFSSSNSSSFVILLTFCIFSAPVLKLVITNYIITDFSPAVNQKSRNFQSKPLYIKYSVLPAYRKPSIKSAVYYAKNVFAFFSAFSSLFAFFISTFSILFAFFILLLYSFSALFAIPIPIFAYKTPPPKSRRRSGICLIIFTNNLTCQFTYYFSQFIFKISRNIICITYCMSTLVQ